MKHSIGDKLSFKEAMALTIEEAKKGMPWVSPNPPVGCVILDANQRLLAAGHHQAFGKDHAEIATLKKIKNKKLLKGAYLFVTLEPCDHQGKTPPCTQALSKYSWNTIYYGQKDLNTKVQGRGIKKLQSKKIKIKQYSEFKKELEDLYQSFNYNMIHKKTFMALKVATTLDGMLARSDGLDPWISSQDSRNHVAWLRACHDAVLIGVGTFLEDNPQLNIRDKRFQKKENTVIILDPEGDSLDLISQSSLAKVRKLSKILVVTKNKKHKKIRTLLCPWDEQKNQFQLGHLKSELYKKENLSSVLVEGGSGTFSSFISQQEAEILYQFLSPHLLGGVQGLSWLESFDKDSEDKQAWNLVDFQKIGSDLLVKIKP